VQVKSLNFSWFFKKKKLNFSWSFEIIIKKNKLFLVFFFKKTDLSLSEQCSGAMLHCYSFLPQEKQPNAASPKPVVSF